MSALSCPKCGAPLHQGMTACPYCGVGFDPAQASTQPPVTPSTPPPVIPDGWVLHKDPWHGFSIAHPSGWRVLALQGLVSVREDPIGICSASIWPYSVPGPSNAYQIVHQFLAQIRSMNPSFQAWMPEGVSPDSNRITIKTRENKYEQVLDGVFNILVNGTNVIISGYEAPASLIEQRSGDLIRILSSFRTIELMPRQMIVEPTENAYSVIVPQGWSYQASVNRNHIGGIGLPYFSCTRDPQGQVAACMPWFSWMYAEGMAGLFGGLSGYQALPFMPAAQFCTQQIVPWMKQFQAELSIEDIQDRPDLAELFQRELAKSGYPPGSFDVSTAILTTTNSENCVRLRQSSRVFVQKQRNTGFGMWGNPNFWTAGLDIYYRAPVTEFSSLEPVLSGILDSMKNNPAWQQNERMRNQATLANQQADIQRRQRQISQTLSETSDIISNSYWNRQASYDRMSEQRSNATLGYQNMVDSSGQEYKVPSGFDQYWADGLGNVYGGGWLSQPDIHWKPLDPTGI